MWPGYLNLACAEIINNERAATYVQPYGLTIDCDRCPDLPEVLGHDPYTTPYADDAPWYDPVRGASVDFLGVFSSSIEGLSASPASREPLPLVRDGSSIGPLRRAHREMPVTVRLLALSECGLSYGLEWLSRSLSGDPCGGNCVGGELMLFACCPGSGTDTGYDASETRYMHDVGVMEGLAVSERIYWGEVIEAVVSFTLVAGNPWIYGEPLATGDDWVSLDEGTEVRADPDQVYQRCLPPTPCATDPECPRPPLPPRAPRPVSPCYPTGVDDFLVTRIRVASEDYPLWSELVPVVEIEPGSADMRRLLVRFWSNPQNEDCAQELDPCDACGDLNVTYVPAGSILTMDGRLSRSTIECETEGVGTAVSPPNAFGPRGGLFQYPYFPCPGGLCVEVWARADTVAADARARITLIPRADVM